MASASSSHEAPIGDIIAQGATSDVVSHAEKWRALDEHDSAFVRAALLKAHKLRQSNTDPGDAYLQAIADLTHFSTLKGLASDVILDLDALPLTASEPDIS